MANERIVQPVTTTERVWRISHLEIVPGSDLLSIRFRSDDGREIFKQLTGDEGAGALTAINTRNNSVKSLHTFLLEQAQLLWPDEFAGVLNTSAPA